MAKEQQQAPQQIHPAAAACEFMQRADLKGGEVDVFAQTFNWLQSILKEELMIIPKEVLDMQAEKLAAYREKYGELEGETPEETPGPENNYNLPEGASFIPDGAKAEAHKPS